MARVYQPELGQNIQQGFANMGSLFAPPSAQEMVARQSIAGQQATQAAQSTARTNIAGGKGTPADFASLGVADPVKNYIMGTLFAERQAHPDASPASFDSGVYISGGDASKTFTGQQAAPLNQDQSRILPPSLAKAIGVPASQHGVIGLGTDDKMLPGSGAQPIVSAPGDPNAAPETTDALAARIMWDKMQRDKAARAGGQPPATAGAAPQLGPSAPHPDPVVSAVIGAPRPGVSTPQQDDPIVTAALNRLGKGAAPQTTIDMKGETAEAAESGKLAAKREDDLFTSAAQAPDKIARLQLLNTVLQKTKTGPLAGAAGSVVALANSLGVPPERLTALGIDANQAVNNETAQKLANELVAGSIGAKNGGFPASNFSVAERQFIEKMFPSIASQPGSNEFVSEVLQAREQRTLQKATDFAAYRNDQRKAGRPVSFNDFDSAWQQQHARENIFQPIIDKFNAGGFSPPGALPPQPGGGMPPTRQSSVATGPGGGQPPTAPAPVGQQSPIAQARAAIAAGAPRDKVLQRLQQQGVDFSGQGL